MITLHGKTPDGRPTLLIGLCDNHIDTLREQGGLRLPTPEGLIIDIMYAENEQVLLNNLEESGLIRKGMEVTTAKITVPGENKIIGLDKTIITPNDSNN